MNTATKADMMADPNDVGTFAAVFGGLGVIGMGLLKLWKQFFADRADAANAAAEIQMLREYQAENKELRARNDAKDQQISSLMQDKFTYQADLKSALEKIQFLTEQLETVKSELKAIKDAVKGQSS